MFAEVCSVIFPKPIGLNINMMPIIFGDNNSLPEFCKQYADIIEKCNFEKGKIAYLSIDERLVQAGESHRRGGVHVERHSANGWGGGWGGGGCTDSINHDGLLMASNVPDSCAIWDQVIEDSDIGNMGDCSHLELKENDASLMKANTLYWTTDRTPHESLQLRTTAYRQWIRVVSSKVDVWYEKHSTANPLGIAPNAKIITFNKFV